MNHNDFEVRAELRDRVQCFWMLEESRELYNSEPIIPDSYIELIINCGAPLFWERGDGSHVVLPRAFVIGLQRGPLPLRASGHCSIVGIRLYAWAAYEIIAAAPYRADAPVVPVGWGWEKVARDLSDTVRLRGYEAAADILQEYLWGICRGAGPVLRGVAAAGRMLYRSDGGMRVGDLAACASLSLSQFERQFKGLTGVTPKAFAKLVRFEGTRNRLLSDPGSRSADLVYDFGYTDQAHFIHEFKSFAACTPGEFARLVAIRGEE